MIPASNLTLAKVLELLGWSSTPIYERGMYRGNRIVTDDGVDLGVLRAGDVWSLLRRRKLIHIEEV